MAHEAPTATVGLEDLKRILAEETSPGRVSPEDTVSPEDIVAYHHGDLRGERAERVRRFLEADPDWAETLASADDPASLEALVDDDTAVDAAWQALQKRLQEESEPAAEADDATARVLAFDAPKGRAIPTPTRAERRIETRRSFLLPLAAALVVGAFLGIFLTTFLGDATPEDTTLWLAELEPLRPDAGPLLGGDARPTLSATDHDVLALKLWPPTVLEQGGVLPARAAYRLLRDGTEVRRGEAEWQSEAYVVQIPTRDLSPGDYVLELEPKPEGRGTESPGTESAVLRYELAWHPDPSPGPG